MSWNLDEKNESSYLEVCKQSVISEDAFNRFRSSAPFSLIVENSPLKSGLEYYHLIKKKFPWLLEYWDLFITSDNYGGPKQYEIGGRLISPSTLRYIKTIGDLHHFFGPLDGMNISEIGPGYGGLCKIIHDVFKPASYTMYDLPEAIKLQNKFLGKFGIKTGQSENIDLLIAMYSWSELSNEMQAKYIESIISKSKNCYIMLNYDMDYSYSLLKKTFKDCEIKDYNLFYDDSNTEYAPYNRFIIIKCS